MSRCQDEDCKYKLTSLCQDFYGKPGLRDAGVRTQVGQKVPKTWIWKFVTTFGLILLIFGGGTWYKAQSASEGVERLEIAITEVVNMVKDNAEQVRKGEIQQAETRKDIENINKAVGKIEKSLEKLVEEHRHD